MLEIKLAKEIINTFETKQKQHAPFSSNSNTFSVFENEFIKIISANETQALKITIYPPLTSSSSNPIICVDDEGDVYRTHGEKTYFLMYAEALLDKEPSSFINEKLKERQILIRSLV